MTDALRALTTCAGRGGSAEPSKRRKVRERERRAAAPRATLLRGKARATRGGRACAPPRHSTSSCGFRERPSTRSASAPRGWWSGFAFAAAAGSARAAGRSSGRLTTPPPVAGATSTSAAPAATWKRSCGASSAPTAGCGSRRACRCSSGGVGRTSAGGPRGPAHVRTVGPPSPERAVRTGS